MYKNILFVLLIIAGVGTFIVFRSGSEVPTPNVQPVVSATNKQPASQPPVPSQPPEPSQQQNGIDITVEKIEQTQNATVLTLRLNNHRYDLGQDLIYTGATLDGQPSVSHTFLSNAVGGHHVQVEVVFNKSTRGSFQITPVDGTTFTFADLWERALTKLKE